MYIYVCIYIIYIDIYIYIYMMMMIHIHFGSSATCRHLVCPHAISTCLCPGDNKPLSLMMLQPSLSIGWPGKSASWKEE